MSSKPQMTMLPGADASNYDAVLAMFEKLMGRPATDSEKDDIREELAIEELEDD